MATETQETGGAFNGTLEDGIAHLAAAAAQLERSAIAIEARFALSNGSSGGEVPRVVAAIDLEIPGRIAELEIKMKAAEQQIAELRANTGSTLAAGRSGRKTLSVAAEHMLAKHRVDTLEQANGGALDAALNGLSLEQRIAVKSQLMRAGLLG